MTAHNILPQLKTLPGLLQQPGDGGYVLNANLTMVTSLPAETAPASAVNMKLRAIADINLNLPI
jgi:hypothetical protein